MSNFKVTQYLHNRTAIALLLIEGIALLIIVDTAASWLWSAQSARPRVGI